MILGIDPIVDFAFKRVFGDERNADILIHLLNAILKLLVPIVSIEILNPFFSNTRKPWTRTRCPSRSGNRCTSGPQGSYRC
jgi:hypothetical protein